MHCRRQLQDREMALILILKRQRTILKNEDIVNYQKISTGCRTISCNKEDEEETMQQQRMLTSSVNGGFCDTWR